MTPEIVGFDIQDWYWISTEGRVYSSASNRILKPIIDRYGYLWVGLYIRNIRKQKLCGIHRLVMLAFNPISHPQDFQVNHIDGVKTNNDEPNLEWVTPRENVRHAFDNGLNSGQLGETNGMSTITNETARIVCELLSTESYTCKQISDMTGCSISIINSIKSGYTWKFISKDFNLKDKHIPKENEVFSYDEINTICKYFEDNNVTNLDLKEKQNILQLLNKECNYNTKKCLSRIFQKRDHTDISSNYNF